MNVVTDTDCANLKPSVNAVALHGYTSPVVSRAAEIVVYALTNSSPGVGTAQAAMDQLRERELIDLLKACTGAGTGIWDATAGSSQREETRAAWDLLNIEQDAENDRSLVCRCRTHGLESRVSAGGQPAVSGIEDGSFYFVHSYAMPVNPWTIAQ